MTKTILICGDRNWNDVETIRSYIKKLVVEYGAENLLFINGGCRGADQISTYICSGWGLGVIEEKADWFKYGKAAGPIRNQLMLERFKPNLVVAFHNDFEHSRGTKDMVNRAKTKGVPTLLLTSTVNP